MASAHQTHLEAACQPWPVHRPLYVPVCTPQQQLQCLPAVMLDQLSAATVRRRMLAGSLDHATTAAVAFDSLCLAKVGAAATAVL